MSRPLQTADITKLESLYVAGTRDCLQLRQIEHELEFRKTSRAKALARKVTLALKKLMSGAASVSVTPQPPVEPRPPVRPLPTIKPQEMPPVQRPPPPSPQTKEPPTQRPPYAPSETELREAYTALKLTTDAAWEDIESSRRHIVAQASPTAVARLPQSEVDVLKNAAANANHAAAILGEFMAKKP